MNILIIAHHFPPLNKVGSYRVYSFAKEWVRQGHNVTVLTTKKYTFDGILNYFPKDAELNKIKIIEIEYSHYLTRYFQTNINKQESKSENEVSSTSSLILVKKIVRYLRRTLIGASFDVHDLWITRAIEKGKELLNKQSFDFIISSYAPSAPHIVASQLKKHQRNIIWVADYRDLWNGNHFDKSNFLIRKSQKRKERKSLQYADLITTVSNPLKEYLHSFLLKNTYIIENGFDVDELSNISKNTYFPSKEGLIFLYSGTIYPGKRDPTPFFRAIKRLEKDNVICSEDFQVLFFGDSGNLKSIVSKEGVSNFVKIMGMVSKDDSLRAQRDCDGLIFLEWEDANPENLSSKGVLTGKLFEYLVSGTEIFAIGISESSIAGNLIKTTRTGQCYKHDDKFIYKNIKKTIQYGKKPLTADFKIINQYQRSSKASDIIELVMNAGAMNK